VSRSPCIEPPEVTPAATARAQGPAGEEQHACKFQIRAKLGKRQLIFRKHTESLGSAPCRTSAINLHEKHVWQTSQTLLLAVRLKALAALAPT
jgi:hypothetical protein